MGLVFHRLGAGICVVMIILWVLAPLVRRQSFEIDYPIDEFNQDMCKIYKDLANFSIVRGDRIKAHKALEIAMAYDPHDEECRILLAQ